MRVSSSGFLVVGLLLLVVARASTAECELRERWLKARQDAEAAGAAFNKLQLSPAVRTKLDDYTAGGIAFETLAGPKALLRSFNDRFPNPEVTAYLDAWDKRDAADEAYNKAEQEFAEEIRRKDQALRKAEEDFAREQQWLEAEKAALQNLPRDGAYLDRVSKITARLQAAYQKMQNDLAGYRPCFPDVAGFLDDKDRRLERIAALDQEIARRRAGDAQPQDQQAQQQDGVLQQPLPGEPPPPGPLGDTWVCDGPEVKIKNGTFTRCDASGFSFDVEVDGKKAGSAVKIKGPPLRIRVNQRVEVVMTASGDPLALNYAYWHLNNVGEGTIFGDNGCSNMTPGKNFKGEGNPTTATYRVYFLPGQDPFFRVYGGQWGDSKLVDIVWRYRKE